MPSVMSVPQIAALRAEGIEHPMQVSVTSRNG